MLKWFETATRAFVDDEDSKNGYRKERSGGEILHGMAIRLSHGTRYMDEADPCDPIMVTKVWQATDKGWAWALAQAMRGETTSPEVAMCEWLSDMHQPSPCFCSYDCCGCRTGRAETAHITGTLFLTIITSSRNY